MENIEEALRDSGLFTQVEPDWIAESKNRVTYINRSRGVVVKVNRTLQPLQPLAHIFYDRGDSTYTSSGRYDTEELYKWWFPVMRSDRAWEAFLATESQDITERALDLI